MSQMDSPRTYSSTQAPSANPEERDWEAIAQRDEFKSLVRLKALFIVPATVFFIAYYFALPILVGYFPKLMETQVVGKVNVAYVFALTQFFVAWAVMAAYVWRARFFDRLCKDVVERIRFTPPPTTDSTGSTSKRGAQ
jgi:uncharacterized membrane protein (DUF485 family)